MFITEEVVFSLHTRDSVFCEKILTFFLACRHKKSLHHWDVKKMVISGVSKDLRNRLKNVSNKRNVSGLLYAKW